MAFTHRWTADQDAFLIEFYPVNGKRWCAERLGFSEGTIRSHASRLNLKLRRDSEFSRDFQARAGVTKTGRKRPDQSTYMRNRYGSAQPPNLKGTTARGWTWGENGRPEHPRGMSGKCHSPEVCAHLSQLFRGRKLTLSEDQRQRMSDRASGMMARRMASGEHAYSRAKRGKRNINGALIFFRSRWEANYARFLSWLRARNDIRSWAYEPHTFWFLSIKRGTRSYCPDFLVVENDGSALWHEVKGWMDDKSRTKLQRMARFYPNETVKVIGPTEYREIQTKLGPVIPGWEW